ncbi:hypothetical protein ACFY1L_46955 [Streptomyces sp. NPDC001663]
MLIPPALDQLREHPEVVSDEVPRRLERLAEVPDGGTHAAYGTLWLPCSR